MSALGRPIALRNTAPRHGGHSIEIMLRFEKFAVTKNGRRIRRLGAPMKLTEAEIQILASIAVLKADGRTTGQKDVEKRGEAYWTYKEDWSGAFDTLIAKGLIDTDEAGLILTEMGRPLAEKFHDERPDLYWYQYQKFYIAAHASDAHSELCKRVFGMDLCQDGQTDMPSLMRLLELLNLRPGDEVLDLGCGAGVIAEFVSDEIGAVVTGLDYSQSAIDAANLRTLEKRNRISFTSGKVSPSRIAAVYSVPSTQGSNNTLSS